MSAGPKIGRNIGNVGMRVIPNTKQFRAAVLRECKAAVKGLEISVKVTADTKQAAAEIAKLARGRSATIRVKTVDVNPQKAVRDVTATVNLDSAQAEAKAASFAAKRINGPTAQIKVDTEEAAKAGAEVVRRIRGDITSVGSSHIRLYVDGERIRQWVREFEAWIAERHDVQLGLDVEKIRQEATRAGESFVAYFSAVVLAGLKALRPSVNIDADTGMAHLQIKILRDALRFMILRPTAEFDQARMQTIAFQAWTQAQRLILELEVRTAKARADVEVFRAWAHFRMNIDADTTRAQEKVIFLHSWVQRNELTMGNVDVDTGRARAALLRLKAFWATLKRVTMTVNAHTATAAAKIAVVARDRISRVRVFVKTHGLPAFLLMTRMMGLLPGLFGRSGGAAGRAGGMFRRLSLTLYLLRAATIACVLALTLLPAALNVIAAMGVVLKSLALLPAMLLGAGLMVGVLISSFAGWKKAKGDLKAFKDELRSVTPEFRAMRDAGRDALLKNVTGVITALSKTHLPALREAFVATAAGMNQGIMGAIQRLQSPAGLAGFNLTMANVATSNRNVGASFTPLLGMFSNLAMVGSTFLPQLSQQFLNATTRWDQGISRAAANGGLAKFIQDGITGTGRLYRSLGNIGASLMLVHGMTERTGMGFLSNMEATTAALRNLLQLPEIQTGLGGFFQGISAGFAGVRAGLASGLKAMIPDMGPALGSIATGIGNAFGAAAQALGPALGALAQGLTPVLDTVGTALSGTISALSPTLTALGTAFNTVLQGIGAGLAPLLEAVGPMLNAMVQPLLTSLMPGLQALNPMFQVLGESLGQMATTFGPMAGAFWGQLGTLASQLVSALAPLVSQALPILAQLFSAVTEAITPLLASLGGGLSQILGSLLGLITPIVSVLLELVAAVLPMVTPLLGQISGIIQQLVPMLVDLINSVLIALMPIITLIVDVLVQLMPLLVALLQPIIALVAPLLQLVVAILPIFVALLQFAVSIISVVIQVIVMLAQWIISLLMPIIEKLVERIGQVIDIFTKVVNIVIPLVQRWVSFVVDNCRHMMTQAVDAVSNGIDSIINWFSNMWSRIKSTLSGWVSQAVQMGRDFVSGILNGLGLNGNAITDKLMSMARHALDQVKSFFLIKSPSKRMDREIGQPLPLGAARGVMKTTPQFVSAMTAMAASGIQAVGSVPGIDNLFGENRSSGAAVIGAAGGVNVTVQGNVGWQPDEVAEAINDRLRQSMVLAGMGAI